MAADDATASAGISATVPVVCDISADTFVLSASGSTSGSVREFCNSDTGFHVSAAYRTLDQRESVSVRYGEQMVELDRSGTALIAFRFGQRLAQVPVTIQARELATPIAVAFSLTAV
ncbi:hypothetical protein [Qipengyuania oceanensis]|uniref:Uncharacterized protein n=1 Tax=Qipengyuania oceanensis TaxID=1463597 RepID=A0A844YH34_9SPHN|nr:hypothetical protein [Qipengyuania oceanensis]MXO63441.1 hypothetical protein [Qipengyuania oceanensis]